MTPSVKPGMHAGQRLRAFRIAAHMTQQETAGWCGFSRPRIAEIESRDAWPKIDTLRKLADAYSTSVSALIGEMPPVELDWNAKERAVAIAAVNAMRNYKEK